MSPARKKSVTYASAGVDIDRGDALVDHLKTINPAIGGFSGLFKLPRGLKNPRLVASTDGVGTKLMVAQAYGRHDTVGIDLVAMTVNDIIVCGAKPLFFLDYIATGLLAPARMQEVLKGIVAGCEQADCPLIGGESAEMPGMYGAGDYDLAGFGVGVVEADAAIDGSKARPGDLILGLASNGVHSNGFSLVRRVLMPDEDPKATRRALRRKLYRGGPTIGEALLEPTRIYVRPVLDLMRRYEIHAAAHNTGGGIEGNLTRVLPKGMAAFIDLDCWTPPRIFAEIARRGPVDEAEMMRVFNMGIGFMLVVPPDAAKKVIARAQKLGEQCCAIGWLDRGPSKTTPPTVCLLRRQS